MSRAEEYTDLDFNNHWATIVGFHGDREPLDVTHFAGKSLASGRVLLQGEYSPQRFSEVQRLFRVTEHGPATDETITTFSLDGPNVVVSEKKWQQVMPPPKEGTTLRHPRDPKILEGRSRDNAITRVSMAIASLAEAQRQLAINL